MTTDRSLTAAVRTDDASGIRWGAAPIASVLVAVCGVGHLVVMRSELVHGLAAALPFLVAALAQLFLARRLWQSIRPVVGVQAVVVLGLLISLYVVAVSAGVTVGPHNELLRADALRTSILIVQLAALVAVLRDLPASQRRWAVNGVLLGGLVLWLLRFIGQVG